VTLDQPLDAWALTGKNGEYEDLRERLLRECSTTADHLLIQPL
jgi:hypothetical protein